MSLAAKIDNLPTFTGRVKFNITLISEYLSDTNLSRIRSDVKSYGFYLANFESKSHESITFEALKNKLKLLVDGTIEKRKNSWVNRMRYNIECNNDKAVASQIASVWRRILSQASLKKAEKSQYGYMLNGKIYSKIKKGKEITALCEWCNAEITVSTIKGFICPCCGVYFHDLKLKKAKINYTTHEFS